jgi:hypothetical protein
MLYFLSMGSYLGESFIACKSAISSSCRTELDFKMLSVSGYTLFHIVGERNYFLNMDSGKCNAQSNKKNCSRGVQNQGARSQGRMNFVL